MPTYPEAPRPHRSAGVGPLARIDRMDTVREVGPGTRVDDHE